VKNIKGGAVYTARLCKFRDVIDLPVVDDGDDPLAQPTRRRLFSLLGELRRAATTSELAELVALHPNGVRLHLERLEQAGLVRRARTPRDRGRPPDGWTIAAGARPGGNHPRAYRDLGRWLARALGAKPGGIRGIERTGREIGRELAPDQACGSDALEAVLTALGFAPAIADRRRDSVAFCLCNCPYRDAVRENQPAVCALHKGITAGLLDVLAPGAELTGFVPHDPDRAGCLIEVRDLDGI
jgi:predicted ArsR family transcriptional regulator